MNRRNFIYTSGASLAAVLLSDSLLALPQKIQVINFPDEVKGIVNDQAVSFISKGKQAWNFQDVIVNLRNTGTSIAIEIQAPKVSLSAVTLHWKTPSKMASNILNDHWERTYGDVSWHKPIGSEILPWYFMEFNGKSTNGFGVKTGGDTFCSWQVGLGTLSMTLDTRSGGKGVLLGDRKLKTTEIVTTKSEAAESPFQTTRRFASIMCENPRLPKQPVYGINFSEVLP